MEVVQPRYREGTSTRPAPPIRSVAWLGGGATGPAHRRGRPRRRGAACRADAAREEERQSRRAYHMPGAEEVQRREHPPPGSARKADLLRHLEPCVHVPRRGRIQAIRTRESVSSHAGERCWNQKQRRYCCAHHPSQVHEGRSRTDQVRRSANKVVQNVLGSTSGQKMWVSYLLSWPAKRQQGKGIWSAHGHLQRAECAREEEGSP